MEQDKVFLTEQQAAVLVGMTERAFRQLRYRAVGPPYMKPGQTVFYHKPDVEGWMLSLRKGGPQNQEVGSPAGV